MHKLYGKSLKFFSLSYSLSQLQGGESQMLPEEHLIISYDQTVRSVAELPAAVAC